MIMLKIVLVAHLTYENQWGKWRTKIQTFSFFGTPYCQFQNKSSSKIQFCNCYNQFTGCFRAPSSYLELFGFLMLVINLWKEVSFGGVDGQRWRTDLRLYLQPRWTLWRKEILTHSCNRKTLGPTVNFDREKIKRNPLLQPFVSAVDTIITTSRGSVVNSTFLYNW